MKEYLETSKHHIRKSASLLLFRIVAITFVLDSVYALILAFLFGASMFPQMDLNMTQSDSLGFLWVAHTARFLITIFVLGGTVLRWCRFTYYITENELIIHKGVIKVDQTVYELEHLHSVRLYQSWVGRLFHYGTVQIEMVEYGHHETIRLVGITDPKKYERVFREQAQEHLRT